MSSSSNADLKPTLVGTENPLLLRRCLRRGNRDNFCDRLPVTRDREVLPALGSLNKLRQLCRGFGQIDVHQASDPADYHIRVAVFPTLPPSACVV